MAVAGLASGSETTERGRRIAARERVVECSRGLGEGAHEQGDDQPQERADHDADGDAAEGPEPIDSHPQRPRRTATTLNRDEPAVSSYSFRCWLVVSEARAALQSRSRLPDHVDDEPGGGGEQCGGDCNVPPGDWCAGVGRASGEAKEPAEAKKHNDRGREH